MREWLADWVEALRIQKGREESSVRVMIRRVEEYLDYCERSGVDSAKSTAVNVEAYMKHLFYKKNSNITRSTKLSAIKGFYEHLVYRGVVESNPAAKIPRPQSYSKALQSFARAEVFAMLKCCDINTTLGLRNAVIVCLGVFCGLRVSEIRALRICDVINSDGVVDIAVRAYEGYRPKRGSERTLRFLWKAPSRLVLRLLAVRAADDAKVEDLLIVSKSGRQMTEANINTMLITLAKVSGLRRVQVTTHMMRATFASSLRFVRGYDIFAIMRACGHRNTTTTERYIADRERVMKEYKSLAAYWADFGSLWGGEL